MTSEVVLPAGYDYSNLSRADADKINAELLAKWRSAGHTGKYRHSKSKGHGTGGEKDCAVRVAGTPLEVGTSYKWASYVRKSVGPGRTTNPETGRRNSPILSRPFNLSEKPAVAVARSCHKWTQKMEDWVAKLRGKQGKGGFSASEKAMIKGKVSAKALAKLSEESRNALNVARESAGTGRVVGGVAGGVAGKQYSSSNYDYDYYW